MYTALICIATTLFVSSSANILTPRTEPNTKCPTTAVNGYEFTCNITGWVQAPKYLKKLDGVKTMLECADHCLAAPTCMSFRYIQNSQKCDLYKARLDRMFFTTQNFNSGLYSERSCFSQDCNTIKACEAIQNCEKFSEYQYPFYDTFSYFGCGYGVQPRNLQVKPTEKLINGSLAACAAMSECGQQDPIGPLVLEFHIPSKAWLCSAYDNLSPSDFEYHTDLHDEHVTEKTLTMPNSSIGASYGFYLEYALYVGD